MRKIEVEGLVELNETEVTLTNGGFAFLGNW
jgi:hypothetical protein